MSENNDYSLNSDELYSLLGKKESMLLFDLRSLESYKSGHVDGSVHAVCDAKTKETIMPQIPKNIKIVLVDDDGTMASEISTMMHTFGLNAHYLEGGMKEWNKKTVQGNPSTTIHPDELWEKLSKDNLFLLDVRDKDEFSDFQIPGSVNITLSDIFSTENISKIPKDKEIVTICPHGNRAMIASFVLERNGIKSHVLERGLAGWSQVLNPVEIAEEPKIIQVEKVGKGCLSYVVISQGEAIIIDPLSPAEKYVDIVKNENATISKVIDTHQHADHVSASPKLSQIARATMYESALELWERDSNFLNDGDEISFGNSKLRVIHTPGHTPGSLSFVIDEKFVFTGDILFIESIGRPDLRDNAEDLAVQLYDSLHEKLLKLPSSTVVFPTHHGISVKSENGVFSTTIEKASHHNVLKLSEEEFVKYVVGITVPRPMNYQKIIEINKGSELLVENQIPDLELGPNRCSITGA